MSYDLKTLAQHREALLLAEVAAWLHNIGKLDPNFIKGPTPRELSIEGYRYQRFAAPDLTRVPDSKLQALLQQELDKEELERNIQTWIQQRDVPQTFKALKTLYEFTRGHGPLYLVVQEKRGQVRDQQESQQIKQYVEEQIQKKVEQWKKQYPDGWEHLLCRKRDEYKQQREEDLRQALEQIRQNEKREERTREEEWRSLKFTLPGSQESWALADLLTLFWDDFFEKLNDKHQYDPGSEDDPDYKRIYLLQYVLPDLGSLTPALLILAHGEVSGQEKAGYTIDDRYCERDECPDNDRAENLQEYNLAELRLSTAFGYEHTTTLDWRDWPQERRHIVEAVPGVWRDPLAERANFKELVKALRGGISDTRLPFNEISLLDYVEPIAAFFKTALAQAVLTERIPTSANMRWRLSSVRVNAFDFLFQANQLSDLLARKQLLDEAQGIIRHVLEVEFPVGADVYADEHGSVFLIPELPEMDKGQIEGELRTLLHNALANPKTLETLQEQPELYGATDIYPTVDVGSPRRGKKLNLPEVLPEKEPINTYDPAIVQGYWLNQKQDLCTACQLRPIGYVKPGLPYFVTREKAKERALCGICLARRGRRAQIWAENKGQETIWIDEVADTNGRMALIVGQFELENWLKGTLVRSLAIGTDKAVGTDKNGTWLAKPPTFARIQRVWRTTQEFWQDIQESLNASLTDDRRRLLLWLDQTPDLGRYHTYELALGETALSLVWHPPTDDQPGHFITCDNLGYTARQLGAKAEIYTSPAAAAICVEDYLRKHLVAGGQSPVLHNPEASGAGRMNLIPGRSIIRLEYQEAKYATVIPILAEPRTFMALVPADKALDVIQAIKQKYEREMGKVHNRLPLHLGAVYFHRRTPLRAALDAGRRMLTYAGARDSVWTVEQDAQTGPLPNEKEKLAEGTQQFTQTITVALAQDSRSLTWRVPAVMGDGATPDAWYPYVFLATNAEPADRARRFQATNPWTGQDGWLVHAGELRQNDRVYFTPATLDWVWLNTTSRRFEIAYDAQGQRRGLPRRPYLLDELETIEHIWQTLSDHLGATQIHALRDLVEAKREAWDAGADDETFHQFCRDALANAGWRGEPWGNDKTGWLAAWAEHAARGQLADAIELYLHIMKEEVES